MKKVLFFALLSMFFPALSWSQLLITAVQSDTGVVISYSGYLNPTGAQTSGPGSDAAFISGYSGGTYSQLGNVSSSTRLTTYSLTNFTGSPAWGLPVGRVNATSSEGSSLLFTVSGSNGSLVLSEGYSSTNLIQGSITFAGMTFNDLGYTEGNYTWSFGSGATNQQITLSVGGSAIPEPSTTTALLGLLACIGFCVHKARNKRN